MEIATRKDTWKALSLPVVAGEVRSGSSLCESFSHAMIPLLNPGGFDGGFRGGEWIAAGGVGAGVPWVDENNSVHAVDAFVETLDLRDRTKRIVERRTQWSGPLGFFRASRRGQLSRRTSRWVLHYC